MRNITEQERTLRRTNSSEIFKFPPFDFIQYCETPTHKVRTQHHRHHQHAEEKKKQRNKRKFTQMKFIC